MNWWKVASRYGPSFIMTVILVTATLSDATEDATQPPEPPCEGRKERMTTCGCDPECARYGDCCRSSPYFAPEEQRLGASPFTCMNLFGKSIYVMTRCPPDWEDSGTRNRCEHANTNYRDPLLDAPVTSKSTNITYRNWYCAFCNSDIDPDTTALWDAEFKCGVRNLYINIPDETVPEHFTYNHSTSQWYLKIKKSASDTKSVMSTPETTQNSENENSYEEEYACNLKFIPSGIQLKHRWSCELHMAIISTCPEDWNDAEVREQCETYTARVCTEDRKFFRNPHCMLCNNRSEVMPCPEFEYGYYPDLSFTKVLRFKKRTCMRSEIYDPFSRICRKVLK
ncbi:hypothetical protein L798_03675 [Zootermopsis nevadensis]|uniref:SMB domain-containing protein n=1 Tax=Zootermopsis nevadensis TaxID=136037 RepID=A0A067RDH1_ZOONE|nr:hypothetical protein L798_03675 [Zootermopsis nevadensis]